jgi:hypothetical protein
MTDAQNVAHGIFTNAKMVLSIVIIAGKFKWELDLENYINIFVPVATYTEQP